MPPEARPKPSADLSFIGFAAADWWYHNRAHSEFQLLTRLARDHKVLLVNSIGMRMPLPGKTSRPLYKIWRKLKSVFRALRRPLPELPDFYVFSPFPLPFYGSALGRRLAAWFVRTQVRAAAALVGLRRPVIFLTPPTAWPVAKAMRRRAVVYNRSDKHSVFNEANQPYIRELEGELLANVELVLYSNETLMKEEAQQTRGRARHLDHGVDLGLFDPAQVGPEPADLAGIPRPRIGFFGGLRAFMVDFALLSQLARSLPAAQIVLVGDPQDSTAELEGIPNIHLLGFKDLKEIPAYGARFDVALLPYQRNDWIRYCNPIKLKEYLALGLSIVATEFPEAHRFEEHIGIACDRDDFVECVRRALESPPDEERRAQLRALVLDMSWDRRTDDFLRFLQGALDDSASA